MDLPSITFFPVGNADTSMIWLKDGSTILIDCQFNDECDFDIPNFLQTNLRTVDGVPHLDVFILTHPHKDHILGIEKAFYLGDPKNFSDKDKKQRKIIIDELWFSPRIFNDLDELWEGAKTFKEEANRRIEGFRKSGTNRLEAGNRLRIIGATNNVDFDDLKAITTIPGTLIDQINEKRQAEFRFFIFAPVKQDSDDDSIGPNNTSIVLQARFDLDGKKDVVRAIIAGDAEFEVWERIVNRNIKSDGNLEWDMLLTPHHCSWTFFNSTNNSEPLDTSLQLLEFRRSGAEIVASSNAIKDDGKNPPNFDAKKLYVKAVGDKKFYCTGENVLNNKLAPLHFTMSGMGVSLGKISETKSSAGGTGAISTPRTYG